ncbi:hypothetical protein [Syntrophothermus sp.]|nr:hypothetical protein [Syntrophothermus sp.]
MELEQVAWFEPCRAGAFFAPGSPPAAGWPGLRWRGEIEVTGSFSR